MVVLYFSNSGAEAGVAAGNGRTEMESKQAAGAGRGATRGGEGIGPSIFAMHPRGSRIRGSFQ